MTKPKVAKAVVIILTSAGMIKGAWAEVSYALNATDAVVGLANDAIANALEFKSRCLSDIKKLFSQLHVAGVRVIPEPIDAQMRASFAGWGNSPGNIHVRMHAFREYLKIGGKFSANPARTKREEVAALAALASEDVMPKAGEYQVKVTNLTSEEDFKILLKKWCTAVKAGTKSETVASLATEFLEILSE